MADKAEEMSFTFNEPQRAAYLNVFDARPFKGKSGKDTGEPKHDITLMIKPDSPDLLGLKQKIAEAARSKWPTRAMSELHFPISTGEKAADKGKAKGKDREFMRGHIILVARSKFPPTVSVLENGKIITLESDALKAKYKSKFYGGCFVAASVNLVPYESELGNDGVTAYIQSVLWVKDGERLASGRDQAEVFKSYMGTTTAENPLASDEIPF